MLYGEIFDAAEELANDNALQVRLYDFDIVHRVSQMVHEHLTQDDKFGKVAIGSYRFHEARLLELRAQMQPIAA